ncbi:MAG: hypothetical protein R8G34_20235 [Paracoccaceae bacterium]|nr:hypothetical protein [Paracoccaceae bacterium]
MFFDFWRRVQYAALRQRVVQNAMSLRDSFLSSNSGLRYVKSVEINRVVLAALYRHSNPLYTISRLEDLNFAARTVGSAKPYVAFHLLFSSLLETIVFSAGVQSGFESCWMG